LGVYRITRATVVSTAAICMVSFEVPMGPALETGAVVTTSGNTTTSMNATLTVNSAGLISILNTVNGQQENWSGFNALLTTASVAIEKESAAFVTTSDGGTNSGSAINQQSENYDGHP
jgi:hypothetical protein